MTKIFLFLYGFALNSSRCCAICNRIAVFPEPFSPKTMAVAGSCGSPKTLSQTGWCVPEIHVSLKDRIGLCVFFSERIASNTVMNQQVLNFHTDFSEINRGQAVGAAYPVVDRGYLILANGMGLAGQYWSAW